MKEILMMLGMHILLIAHSGAIAADPKFETLDQMCNDAIAGKVGEERKSAMATCRQEKYMERTTTGTQQTERSKLKQCQAEALAKDKADAQAYLKDCMAK